MPTATLKLYEIPAALRAVFENGTDPETGELTEAALVELAALEETLDRKADGVCAIIREQLTLASAVQAEVDRLKKMVQVRENNAKRLKDYLKFTMEQAGVPKIETERFKIRIQKNSAPSVEITIPVNELPKLFQRVTTEADKEAAVMHWKEKGEAPRGFGIVFGSHLRIS
jgi:hypothetical protein